MSDKTSDVFRAGDITVDGTLNSNESQLIFRPKQRPYNPYSGQYYSLSAAQIDDPTIRINQYAANGTFENFGYLYDTQFNPIPPGTRVSVAGGVGDPTQEPNPCIIYSYDNIHWDTWSNPTNLLAGGGCTALAYNGFIFAAGGSAGAANRMLYSANGSSWIASSSGTTLCVGGCNNIATNGGFWIAGTQGAHRLIFSFDGINWYASSTTQGGADFYLTTSCNAAAWSGSLWLVGGRGDNNIIRSTDGFFWQRSDNANTIFEQCNAVAWNGSFWLAGGIPATQGGTTIAISFDGITWTPIPVTYPTTGTPVYSLSISCNAIGWSGAQWVIGGEDASGNTLAYSYDGTAWFPGTNSTFIVCNAVSWNGNSWTAAGVGANSLVTSFSGANWTPSVEGNRLLIEGGAVAVNKILPNASTVQQITVTTTSSALTLVGASGETVIAFSKDGITWTPSTSAASIFPGGACLAFSWNGFTWTAGLTTTPTSPTYTMGNSADGILWSKNATGSSFLNISCNGITNNEAYWLAGGAGETTRLIYSVDSNGITWADVSQSHAIFDASASNLVSQGICNTVGWSGLLWVAGANCRNNRLAYSYDVSTNWTGSATGNAIFTTSCNSVAWNGLLWVAVGSAGNASVAAYSYDGITWTDISDANVKGARSWATVACNESVWIMGGRQVSGECILFSYDGIHWSNAIGTGGDFQNGCTGVTWNGEVWVATGIGNNSVIYSYNGAAWVNSYNGDGIFPTGAQSVAANRPQATTGATRPTPTLYAADIPSVGAVTYTPKDARLNSLYPSNTLFLDDIRRNVGINIVPTTHLNVGGSTITPVLDISSGGTGTGIYLESGNGTEPSLSLMNRASAGARISRIEMLDISAAVGWSIDDLRSTNHLQLTSWNNNQPYTVVDITPGDTGAGQVDINGIDPLAPNGAALFVDGRSNQNDRAISVLGNVNINGVDPSGAALYVNGMDNLADLAINVDGNVNINGPDPNGAALYVNGMDNLADLAINVDGNVNINGPDPSGAALYVNGMDNPADLALNVDGVTTLQETHATDVYLNKINPNGADVQIGTDTVNLTVRSNTSTAVQLIGKPNTRFYKDGNANYVEYNGTDFFPSPTNTLNLGLAGNHWNTFYTNIINYDRTDLLVGDALQPGNLLIRTSDSTTTKVYGYPKLDLITGLFNGIDGGGIRIDGINNPSSVIPIGLNPVTLGSPTSPWPSVYATQINQNGSNLIIGGTTNGITVFPSGGAGPSIDTEIRANGNRRLVLTSSFYNSTNQYLYWDGSAAFSYPFSASLGVSANPWNNLFAGNVNPNSSNLVIGNLAGGTGITVWPIASTNLYDSEIRANGGRRLVLSSSYNFAGVNRYLCWDGSGLFPFDPANLGTAGDPWANLYANQVNPATYTPSPGSTRYASYDSSVSGTGYLPDPGIPGTYNLYIQLVGGGGGSRAAGGGGGGGGGGAFTGIAITGVPPSTRYDYVCGGGGATTVNGTTTSIYFPSLFLQYIANPGSAVGAGSGGAGGTAQVLGGNIVDVGAGNIGTAMAGGLGGLAGATYLGQGGAPPGNAGAAGYVSIDTQFVPTPITVNNTLTGTTRLDQLIIKPGFGGGIGLIANAAQMLFGVNGSLNTSQYMFWNGETLGPSLTNTTDLGATDNRWDNLYVRRVNAGSMYAAGSPLLLGVNGGTDALNIGATFVLPGALGMTLGSSYYPWNSLYTNNINITTDPGLTFANMKISYNITTTFLTLPTSGNIATTTNWKDLNVAGNRIDLTGPADWTIIPSPDTGGTDLAVQLTYYNSIYLPQYPQPPPGVPVIISSKSGTNNMNIYLWYVTGTTTVFVKLIQLGPGGTVNITRIYYPYSAQTGGYAFKVIKWNTLRTDVDVWAVP